MIKKDLLAALTAATCLLATAAAGATSSPLEATYVAYSLFPDFLEFGETPDGTPASRTVTSPQGHSMAFYWETNPAFTGASTAWAIEFLATNNTAANAPVDGSIDATTPARRTVLLGPASEPIEVDFVLHVDGGFTVPAGEGLDARGGGSFNVFGPGLDLRGSVSCGYASGLCTLTPRGSAVLSENNLVFDGMSVTGNAVFRGLVPVDTEWNFSVTGGGAILADPFPDPGFYPAALGASFDNTIILEIVPTDGQYTVSIIPLPPALWLTASALTGLFFAGRRLKCVA